MAKAGAQLTPLELELMQVIWQRGASDVNQVQAGLARPLAYTTVQTVLNTLHRKGKLRRRLRGRAYVYAATVTRARAMRTAVSDLVERMFGGSSEALVMSLLRRGEIDADTIARLSRELAANNEPEGDA